MKTKNAGLLYIFESRLLYLPRPPSVHSAFLVFCSSRFSEYHTLSAAYCPPYDEQRDFVWTKGKLRSDGCVYGIKEADGKYHYELRYNPAPDVILWVEEMDRNYILQLKREGKLLEKEPNGDKEIKTAEDTPADKDGWGRRHQFHDEIFAAFAAARDEVKQQKRLAEERIAQETEVQYQKSDGYWHADLRLDESPEMRQCMERRDIEYLRNLEREGHLLELEPYADLEIAEDHAFKTEIRAVMERARGMPSLKLFCAFFINRNPEAQALLMQVKSYLPITLYSFLRRLPNIRAAEERAETTLAVQYKRAAETREAERAPKTARLEK